MVDLKSLKNDLQNIIFGKIEDGKSKLIKAAQSYLRESFATSPPAKEKEHSREQEEEKLIDFITANKLWLSSEIFGTYITEGAEQKVYFPGKSNDVIKISDAVFYVYWEDYFNSLLIHNYLFPDTAYTLVGFYKPGNKLYAVVEQRFITSTEMTNLDNVKQFMLANGFLQKRDNDYYHPFLGLIIEDLHDENVLTNNEVLFFTDTVIYITKDFYK